MAIAPTRTTWPIVDGSQYEGSRIPSPIPTVKRVDPERVGTDDIFRINFGPNHPSTHGVLRLIVDLDGETVEGIEAVIGYLHTGFEKSMEGKTFWKCVTFSPRMDYVGFQNNELTFVLAAEKLLGLEIPTKATWMRMLLSELSRIHSHLIFLGTSALELGAVSMFWYCFREREMILDLFEMVTGQRMHTRYFQIGGLAEDIPEGFYPECRTFVDWFPHALNDYLTLLDRNAIWLERMEGQPWIVDDRKIVLPPREELHTSMESLIHHFKIVTEGFRVPEGEVYFPIESPRGELGCYVVSDGGPKPWRVKFRAPSFVALEATATCTHDALVADLIAIVGSLDTVMGEVDR